MSKGEQQRLKVRCCARCAALARARYLWTQTREEDLRALGARHEEQQPQTVNTRM